MSKFISIEREERILEYMDRGWTDAEIIATGLASQNVIRAIRRSGEVRERPVPRKIAGATYFALKHARRCPTCGQKVLIWPCIACHPFACTDEDACLAVRRYAISKTQGRKLYEFVSDFLSASRLNVIREPLFKHLADQAKRLLHDIHDTAPQELER